MTPDDADCECGRSNPSVYTDGELRIKNDIRASV